MNNSDNRRMHLFSSLRKFALILITVCSSSAPSEAVQVMMLQGGEIRLDENVVVQWIFENQQSLEQARKQLDEAIQTRIDLVSVACELTPEQQQKLHMAGVGDIHRFFNEFEALRRTIPVGNVSQQEYQEVWQRVQPVRQRFRNGLHSRESLFARSIQYVLDAKQQSRYNEFERKRTQRKYESMVKGTIAMLENEIPLTSEQRKELLKITLEQKAPTRVDIVSYYRMYLVLYKMSKIPEDQLQPIFLENEWKAMKQLMQRAKGYEQMLRREGFLLD